MARSALKNLVAGRIPRQYDPCSEEYFRLTVSQPQASVAIIITLGELDMATVPRLADSLDPRLNGDFARVVLDFSQLDFLGAAGLSLLVHADSLATRNGTELVIVVGENRTVNRALEASRLNQVLTLVEIIPAAR